MFTRYVVGSKVAGITLDKDGLAKASWMLTMFNYGSPDGDLIGITDECLLPGVGIQASACTDVPADPGWFSPQ